MPLLRDLSFSKAHPSTTYGHLYGEYNKKIVYIYCYRERENLLGSYTQTESSLYMRNDMLIRLANVNIDMLNIS